MVTFKLKEENDQQLVYWYFPHGNEENDIRHNLSVAEARTKDNIEQIPELTDEEWPEATEDRISTVFADHAIQKIVEAYNNGEILEEGVETWNL